MAFYSKHICKSLFIIALVLFAFFCFSQKNNEPISISKANIGVDTIKADTVLKINYDQMIDSIICFAEKHLGIRYRAGGKTKSGFDCSGFIFYVFSKFGMNLPNGARNQALKGMPLEVKDIKKGDLVFFKGRNSRDPHIGHVGLVVEKNDSAIRFIHASTRKGVTYDFTYSDYYRIRFIGAKRLLGENIIDSIWADFKMPLPGEEDSLLLAQTDSLEPTDSIGQKQTPQNYSSVTYTVKKGETLFAIAKKNNTTVEKIKELNHLKSDKIRPDQVLIVNSKQIPATKPQLAVNKNVKDLNNIKDTVNKPEKKAVNQPSQKTNPKNYTVRKGDNLYAIAKKNHTTADKIKELNKLNSDKIQPGQKLILK